MSLRRPRVSVSLSLALACAFAFCLGVCAQPAPAVEEARTATHVGRPLVVYVREACPHCERAKEFLRRLAFEQPALAIVVRAVDRDPAAARDLSALTRAAGRWPPGVPTFVYDGVVLVGYDDEGRTERALRARLAGAAPVPREAGVETAFGSLSAARLGLPLFTLALGLVDGLNPCAMWVLLFLLSLLVHLRDRRRMALIAGTFVLVSGAVYFAFMAAWLNLFLAVGLSTPVRVLLGGVALLIGSFNVKDFIAWGRGPSLGIPSRAKPRLYARMRQVLQARALPASLAGVAVLAVVVNLVELLCTAGLPAVFTAVLARQDLPAVAHYGYLSLYILGYVADDALLVGSAVYALGSGKLGERGARRLKLLSGGVMLALGATLLWRPGWLL